MREDAIDYPGDRLDLLRDGLGWHAFIYPPDSAVPLCDVPVQARDDGRQLIISEAKKMVRRHQSADPTRQRAPTRTRRRHRTRPDQISRVCQTIQDNRRGCERVGELGDWPVPGRTARTCDVHSASHW